MEYIVTANGLTKHYGAFKALNGISLHLPKGAIYGLVGRNGAGKTTLIRLLCGLQTPSSGRYTLYGEANDSAGIAAARRRMGAVVETPSIYLDMSAEENLRQQFRILGLPSCSGIAELLRLVGLENTQRKKAANFSLGMKQRLGIAIALAGDPDFLLLDEPINGLDPEGIVEMRELILRLNRERQITVLISSHILDELSRLATHYGFIDHGQMVREISAQELEESCRKCSHIRFSDALSFCRVMGALHLPYSLVTDNEADIYDEIDVTEVVQALDQAGCRVLSLSARDESLENYFINLLGGQRHE